MMNNDTPNKIWTMRKLNPHQIYKTTQNTTPEILNNLHGRYPFLQITNLKIDYGNVANNGIIYFNNFVVIDHTEALSCSMGPVLFRQPFSEDAQGGHSSHLTLAKHYGSTEAQTIDMANELIHMILQKSWQGIYFVNGTPFMKKVAWFTAQKNDIPTDGFEPNHKEKDLYKQRFKTVHKKGTNSHNML